ncbi:hypothetical protein FKW77_006458 [Venturia effusa]|uniref:Cyanovirin-N domain-containing protein n=1 Tax=Venturia effusa TaxID=50376 RepID=A0A517LDW8_9PEZI|nr:hypothetical protein FKW77_006458 [Venturia effusa]
MFKILTTLLVCLVAITSAWPTASSLLTRDASADPAALPAADTVHKAVLNIYNASTSTNMMNGSKKCQTQAVNTKLEEGACYSLDKNDLGVKLTGVTSGCKVYGYATPDCTADNQQITAGCFDVSSDTGSQLSSLMTVC